MLYVQYGAGFSCPEGWLNFDVSPTLRIQRLPLIGVLVPPAKRFPPGVLFGDIVNGLPVAPSSADGVYASHVLEHLALNDFRSAIRNTFNILRPGGIFRCVVPDLAERARRYLSSLDLGDVAASLQFLRASGLGLETRPRGAERLRVMLGNSAHLWMWDEKSLTHELKNSGFCKIRRCKFGDAVDPAFKAVEEKGRFSDEGWTPPLQELAIEACKPLSGFKSTRS